jgi:hypothetical protein
VRDVALSEYAWQQRIGVFEGDLGEFIDDFISGRGNPFGSWGAHVDSWVQPARIADHRLSVVRYEDLKREPATVLGSVLSFLNVSLDADTIRKVVDANTVERMREKEDRAPEGAFKKRVLNRNVRFINTGSAGQWQKRLSAGQQRLLEDAFAPQLQRLGYPLHS